MEIDTDKTLNKEIFSKDTIDDKLDELKSILSTASLTAQELSYFQDKLHTITDLLAEKGHASGFLRAIKIEDSAAKKYNLARRASRIARMVAALLMILLGFGMIVMPAPEYFEMFTLFYISPNDGVTIMDVISLIVAFAGVSLLISTIIRFNHGLIK